MGRLLGLHFEWGCVILTHFQRTRDTDLLRFGCFPFLNFFFLFILGIIFIIINLFFSNPSPPPLPSSPPPRLIGKHVATMIPLDIFHQFPFLSLITNPPSPSPSTSLSSPFLSPLSDGLLGVVFFLHHFCPLLEDVNFEVLPRFVFVVVIVCYYSTHTHTHIHTSTNIHNIQISP